MFSQSSLLESWGNIMCVTGRRNIFSVSVYLYLSEDKVNNGKNGSFALLSLVYISSAL